MSPGGNGRNQGGVCLDPLGPGRSQERYQRSVAFLQMFDARADRDHPARSLRAHDGWQPWPIAVAACNHQEIVLIDRRGLDRDHDFAGRWCADVGNYRQP
jgi:hypothetical protein